MKTKRNIVTVENVETGMKTTFSKFKKERKKRVGKEFATITEVLKTKTLTRLELKNAIANEDIQTIRIANKEYINKSSYMNYLRNKYKNNI